MNSNPTESTVAAIHTAPGAMRAQADISAFDEAEVETATAHARARLERLAVNTARHVEEYLGEDLVELLIYAYILTLREKPPADVVDARAAVTYLQLLAHSPTGFEEATDLLLLDSFAMCAYPDNAPRPARG